ncbi:hypothetical protein Vi05172_g5149 [Venturia inaequalis]|nr:hypothetical protein Vi05172_g5149 [Venturia inaequalis]
MVTLIWPYSSSTQSFALLLAEPDFRLRNKKGQVLVRFQGASAAALARAGIGSGDEVQLHLEGVQWLDADPGITTPGRCVDTELLFKRKLVCQIIRDGQELANINVEDDTVSERSPSPSPSTAIGPCFAYANPRLSELHDLSTPASSAFHKRARVSGGVLVDSPYDPFVRKEGEPIRKKARHSWGYEARWTVESDVPSPSKKNRTTDWIQDEDLLPSRKPSRRSTPIEDTQLPVFQPSPIVRQLTETRTHEMGSQYTQELVNQVSGDTEEDADMQEVQSSGTCDRMGREQSYESPLRQSFSVFRDATFARTNEVIGEPMDFETEYLPDLSEPLVTTSLQEEEDSFFNLPSSDSIEALDVVENGMNFGGPDGEISYIAFQRTSSLARELLESDEVGDEDIERQARSRSDLGIESQGSEQSQGEDLGDESSERNDFRRQENSREEVESEAPIIEDVESGDLQIRLNSQTEQTQRESQVRQKQEIESSVRRPTQPADSIDPTLQGYEAPKADMAPPSLPMIHTSNFDSGLVASSAAPSRPRSPRTPDLRPQESAALPLPSPFPGDDLATSCMDDGAPDWQPSQGFMVPLRKTLPGFGFGFGFESDGLDRRYSTEVDDPDTNKITALQIEITGGNAGLDSLELQLAVTSNTKTLEPEKVLEEDIEAAMPGGDLTQDELQMNFSLSEASSHKEMLETEAEDVIPLLDAPPDPILHQDMVHGISVVDTQTPYTEEQVVSAQLPVETVGAEMADGDMVDAENAKSDAEMLDFDEVDEDATLDRELPRIECVSDYASQASISEVEHVPDAPNLIANEIPSTGRFRGDRAGSEHAAYDESEEEGGILIEPDDRFGPPLPNSAGPLKSVREVISLLSDSDDDSLSGGDSDLESVDGDQEDARVDRANLMDDEVEEACEEEDSGVDEYSEDDDVMESNGSGSEDDDDPDQGSRTHALEASGSRYIPSFDGANDSPPPSMSEDRYPSSIATLDPRHASNLAPAPIDDRVPSSTAPLPQTGKTVVIELGSDSESEEESQIVPSTAPLPTIKHESTEKTAIKDTYEPSNNDDDPTELHSPADQRMGDQLLDPSQEEQQQTVLALQKLSNRRPAVTFAPRVSRRRALGGSQLTTQLGPQSSQALASSQDTFRRPRLVIQDTFEGMVHSDGSVTTAPPSSRGHDSEATTDDECASPATQIKMSANYAQPMSSPPTMSDAYPDDQTSYPNPNSEVTQPQQYSRRQRSQLQQSVAESTLVTPDASQFTQSQPSFSAHDGLRAFPPTPKLTQTPSNSSRHNQISRSSQQSFDEDFQNHTKFGQNVEKAVAGAKSDVTTAERSTQDASKALVVKLNKLNHDDFTAAFLEESENLSKKMRASSNYSSSKLDTWLSPRKPKHRYRSSSEASHSYTAKLDLSLSPCKPKDQYQPSSPPQSFENEAMLESQTMRGDRFDSDGVEFDEKDAPLSSQFDTANSRVSMSPTVKHQKLMKQSLKDELRSEKEDHPSSQLPDLKFSQGQPSQTKGLSTSWGYYTPVSNLLTKVSTQTSQFPDDLADVIAVVTKSSTRPLRAESGPKDFVTEFLISDEGFWPNKLSVKIYRPWKPALPVLEEGDLILLRGFNVLSTMKGVGLYMRSNASSSWCAWKFNLKVEENDLSSDDDQPKWSQKIKAGKELTLEDREVCTAAEAQRGNEERDFVQELREWWVNKG